MFAGVDRQGWPPGVQDARRSFRLCQTPPPCILIRDSRGFQVPLGASPRPGPDGVNYRLRGNVIQVAHGRHDRTMPKLLANQTDLDPFLSQFARVRVAEPVGMHTLCYSCLAEKPLHQSPHVGRCDPLPPQGAEDWGPAINTQCCPQVEPGLQHGPRPRVQPDQPRSVTLAVKHPGCASVGVEVLWADPRASLILRPARQSTTTKARFRVPGSVFVQAARRPATSDSFSGSGGNRMPLLLLFMVRLRRRLQLRFSSRSVTLLQFSHAKSACSKQKRLQAAGCLATPAGADLRDSNDQECRPRRS